MIDPLASPWAPTTVLEALFQKAPVGLCVVDRGLRFVRVNEYLAAIAGRPVAAFIGRRLDEMMPDMARVVDPLTRRVLETGEPVLDFEVSGASRRDPARRSWFAGSSYPVRDAKDEIIGVGVVALDVTARRLAEEALRESEARFRQLSENIAAVFWLAELDPPRAVYLSPAFEQIWGRSLAPGPPDARAFLAAVHPDDRPRFRGLVPRIEAGGCELEYRIVRPDGSVRWIRDRAFPIRDAAGGVQRAAGIATDVTDQKLLEEQLHQAQKMESIGRLAGGVAHDFNNLMTAILGHATFATASLPDGHAAREDLAQIEEAARRASALTRQLLAFARRQVIEPRVVDVSDLVRRLDGLLRRLIGEDVELVAQLDPEPACVRADASQLEQVLVNLAVNARDAMPGGGKLVLETSGAEAPPGALPGRWIRVSVSDTGHGIPPEVRAHLFEPFFTTKEPGKGTGLGLATCYGILQDCGGRIAVESAPGAGARFDVFLPRVEPEREASRVERVEPVAPGTETVLLAEDEPLVRAAAARALRAQGYTVIDAADGLEALALARAHAGPIHLLVADVIMPRLGGVELARRLRAERPDTKVLHVSGHLDRSFAALPAPPAGADLLQKPFVPDDLARRVRAALDAGGGGTGA